MLRVAGTIFKMARLRTSKTYRAAHCILYYWNRRVPVGIRKVGLPGDFLQAIMLVVRIWFLRAGVRKKHDDTSTGGVIDAARASQLIYGNELPAKMLPRR